MMMNPSFDLLGEEILAQLSKMRRRGAIWCCCVVYPAHTFRLFVFISLRCHATVVSVKRIWCHPSRMIRKTKCTGIVHSISLAYFTFHFIKRGNAVRIFRSPSGEKFNLERFCAACPPNTKRRAGKRNGKNERGKKKLIMPLLSPGNPNSSSLTRLINKNTFRHNRII